MKVSLGSAYYESFWRWHLCIFLLTSRTQGRRVSWHYLRIWRWPPGVLYQSCIGLCTHRQVLCPPPKILLSSMEDHSYCPLWSRDIRHLSTHCSATFCWPAFLVHPRTSFARIQRRRESWCHKWWWRSERLCNTFLSWNDTFLDQLCPR